MHDVALIETLVIMRSTNGKIVKKLYFVNKK